MFVPFYSSFSYEFNQDGVFPIFIENRGPTQPGLVNYLLTDVNLKTNQVLFFLMIKNSLNQFFQFLLNSKLIY